MFNEFFIKYIHKDSILVKSADRVVYKISSEHNTFFISIDSNGPIAYKSNISEESISYYKNVTNSFGRKSGLSSFYNKEGEKGEFENGDKDAKTINFKYYVKKD